MSTVDPTGGSRWNRIWPWIGVLAVVVFVAAIRMRLAPAPLERDEGEYAYAAQLILQGVPPYQLAYNMKFPGTYYAYAAIIGVFGESTSAIRLGLLLVNASSIVLLFVLGRRLLGDAGGVVAALVFGLMSVDQGVLGAAAHATHFLVLCAVGGLALLLRRGGPRGPAVLLGAGALLGAGVLMKQHAIFFLPLAAALAWRPEDGETAGRRAAWRRVAWTALGAALPVAVVAAVLAAQGVLDRAWFWTFGYALEYVSEVRLADAPEALALGWGHASATSRPLWALAWAGLPGLLAYRWETPAPAVVLGMTAASFLAICPGFFFRDHYFIVMLPALALLAAVACLSVGRLAGRFLPISPAGPFACGPALLVAATYIHTERHYLFAQHPRDYVRARYGDNPFPEALEIARYIRANTEPDERIAVLGSEPEIYYYAQRRSATGYIYMYPLMEPQAYASRMQAELMREVEAAHPSYLVLVQIRSSWGPQPSSDRAILDWTNRYVRRCYSRAGIADLRAPDDIRLRWDAEAREYHPQSERVIVTLRRNGAAPCTAGPEP